MSSIDVSGETSTAAGQFPPCSQVALGPLSSPPAKRTPATAR